MRCYNIKEFITNRIACSHYMKLKIKETNLIINEK